MVGAALAAPLRGVIEGLGTGVHTLASVQVALHPKLIWSKIKIKGINGSIRTVIFGASDGN